MRAWITKILLGLTLGSVCILAVACAPTCYLDEASAPIIPTACHDTQSANDETVCNWDAGNLSFQEDSGNHFKLVLLFVAEKCLTAPDSLYPVFRKVNSAFISMHSGFFPCAGLNLKFVRLII